MRPRPAHIVLTILAASVVAACSSTDRPASPSATPATPAASPSPTPTQPATPLPTPTPEPTPRFTNAADPDLVALIPESVGGVEVVRVPIDEFGLTPGDVGLAYGEPGTRFSALAIAYVGQPRTSLYAMRVDGEPVTNGELEPHLATAGRFVGIAGLDPDPWEQAVVHGHSVWVRPEDNATAAGTMIYTWSAGEFVFLLIGVDDALNQALVAALPGMAPEATPSPTAGGSGSPAPATPSPSPSPGASG
jgi:hypothetical protein